VSEIRPDTAPAASADYLRAILSEDIWTQTLL
jgi:hypothetical protein